ncbi:MAG: flavin-binding protein dodecin, partial [Acidimicrobiales bacterium]
MIQQLPGRVDKVIQIVAVSPESWEAAAQNAVAQATKSIRDLTSATVVEQDLSLANGAPLYRIKLQVAFQVDRTRTDAAGTTVQVRRFLLVANQTLANAELSRFVSSTMADQCAEFHVVVPQNA